MVHEDEAAQQAAAFVQLREFVEARQREGLFTANAIEIFEPGFPGAVATISALTGQQGIQIAFWSDMLIVNYSGDAGSYERGVFYEWRGDETELSFYDQIAYVAETLRDAVRFGVFALPRSSARRTWSLLRGRTKRYSYEFPRSPQERDRLLAQIAASGGEEVITPSAWAAPTPTTPA